MSDISENPIAGRGAEMIPEKGNPFAFQETAPPADPAGMLAAWEEERANDLASSEAGRSTRKPGHLPAIAPDNLFLSSPKNTTPAGGIAGTLNAAVIPSASLPESTLAQTFPLNQEAASPVLHVESRAMLINELLERVEDARWKLTDTIENLLVGRELLDRLHEAKLLLEGDNPMPADAERYLQEVEYRIQLAERSLLWSKVQGRQILWYGIVWLIIGAALLAVLPLMTFNSSAIEAFSAAIIGSLGGVLSALTALRRPGGVSEGIYTRGIYWYTLQPVAGLILGGFLFMIYQAFSAPPGHLSWLYILSALAGFLQNSLYRFANRLRIL